MADFAETYERYFTSLTHSREKIITEKHHMLDKFRFYLLLHRTIYMFLWQPILCTSTRQPRGLLYLLVITDVF